MDVYPMDSTIVGAEEFVYPTVVIHQQLFYLQVGRSELLSDVMDEIMTRYAHLQPEEKPLLNKRLGSLCVAKLTDNGIWYRAKITGLLKNGHIEVQFVDCGSTDYVTEERIKAIDVDLIKYPAQGYRCCLADVSCPQEFWTPEQIIQFKDRVFERRCLAKFVGVNEAKEMYLLQLWDSEGNNINQLFGAVNRVKSPVKKALLADVSTYERFYIQPVESEEEWSDEEWSDMDSLEAVDMEENMNGLEIVDDDAVYSAQVGNSDVVGADRLKAPPQELTSQVDSLMCQAI